MRMCIVSTFVNSQLNLGHSYVSGMKEDLAFTGNQYNTLLSMFTAGYVIGYAMLFARIVTLFHSHLLIQSISRHFAHGQNFSIHLAAILCVYFT